jgi:hypothetical protein
VWLKDKSRLSLLCGARVLDLRESLDVLTTISPQVAGQVTFQGANVAVGDTAFVNDHFDAHNRFGGFNMAMRCEWQCDACFVNFQTSVAVGSTKQTINIIGNSIANGGLGLGGFLAQRTNIGTASERDLAIVPELNLMVGVHCGPHCRIFGGYDLLLWNVARPGGLIDANINLNNAPVTVATSGTTFTFAPGTGPNAPSRQFNSQSIIIQGLQMGFEILY